MASRKLEEKIEELRRLRRGVSPGDVDDALRKALGDRSNLVVAEAARIAGELRHAALIPLLLEAFDRLFKDPVKTDPKCWGKTAIVKALTSLDYSDSPPFVRGTRHIQMEPVWGGQEDAACQLRANATLALVQCKDLRRSDVLRHLVDSLWDDSDTVRIEAVRAIEQMNGEEAPLLLRLKALARDTRPVVLGQVFDSLLQLEKEYAVPFVVRFLESVLPEVCDEAALALGGSRLPAAVQALIGFWPRARGAPFRSVVLRALSSSREESALGFLLDIVKSGASRECAAALEALDVHKDSPEIMKRVEEAKNGRKTS